MNKSIMLKLVEPQLLPAISRTISDASATEQMTTEYYEQVVSLWDERTRTVAAASFNAEELRDERKDLNGKAHNIVDALQDDGRNPLLVQRLKTIQEEIASLDAKLAAAAEIIPPRPSEEEIRELITRQLSGLLEALSAEPEALKQKLFKHIDKLTMKLVETPEGPRYQVTGGIRLFATGDAEDVLLAASSRKSCKQYTPLSFPVKTSLIVKADEWEKKNKE